jgi:ribosomal protein S18 acetylase RimI-like enzyme
VLLSQIVRLRNRTIINNNSDYRLLTLSDVEQAAQVISQAFVDDPLCAFMLPFKRTRVKTLYKFFRAYGEVNIKNQRGFGVGDPLEGVAFWKSASQKDISISIKSLSTFFPLLLTLYPIGLLRAGTIMEQIDMLHQKHVSGPHYYLDNIGVLSSARGKGLASKLIRPLLDKADSERVAAYTDTVTRSNVALYEHFGFHCVEECAVPRAGITVWALLRPIQEH